jgi:hypothetical protein
MGTSGGSQEQGRQPVPKALPRRTQVVKWPAPQLNSAPYPVLATFVPPRLHVPRPRRRGRRRRYVDGRVGRRIGGPGHVPRRRRRWQFALVGPDVARPGGVAARRADCRCFDGRSRQRKGCRRDHGGQTANKPRHCRPLAWTRCPTLGFAQLMPGARSLWADRLFVRCCETRALLLKTLLARPRQEFAYVTSVSPACSLSMSTPDLTEI